MKYNLAVLLIALMVLSPQIYAQEQGPEGWEETIQKFEKRDKANPPKKGAILFVGSSSIAMWKDIADYFPDYDVINRGFGGSQFSDLIYYADRVIYPYQPSKIFIYEGDNDLAYGGSVKATLKKAKRLRKMIEKALPGVPVIFISAKPSISRWELKEKYERLNKALERYAKRTKLTAFADVWSAMLDSEGNVIETLFLEDDLHMNASGYDIWKSVLIPYLEKEEIK